MKLIQIIQNLLKEKNTDFSEYKKNLSKYNKNHDIFNYNLGKKIGSSTKTAYLYKDNPNYIIKDFDDSFYNTGIKKEYKLSKKYPDYFAHILKLDLKNKIVIQEKLDTSQVTKDINFFKSKYKIDLKSLANELLFGSSYKLPSFEYYEKIIKDKNDLEKIKKYYFFYKNILEIFKKENIKQRYAHINNIGFDKNNNLKIFDLD